MSLTGEITKNLNILSWGSANCLFLDEKRVPVVEIKLSHLQREFPN